MFFIVQVSSSSITSACLAIEKYKNFINEFQIIFINKNNNSFIRSCGEKLVKKLSEKRFKNKVKIYYVSTITNKITNLLNWFIKFIKIELPIIQIYQSDYCYWGFFFSGCRTILIVGDGFGISTIKPMNNGKIKGLFMHNTSNKRILRRCLMFIKDNVDSVCSNTKLFNYVDLKKIKEYLSAKDFMEGFFKRNFINSSNTSNFIIFAPSNFSENQRISLFDEVNLYLEDLNYLLSKMQAKSNYLIFKPHPLGNSKKLKILKKLLIKQNRSDLKIIFDKTIFCFPIESIIYTLKSLFNINPTLLTYQTSYNSLYSLNISSNIKVGFHYDSFYKLFFSHSREQRLQFQKTINNEYRL